MADENNHEDNDEVQHITVGKLLEALSKFDKETPVVIMAHMGIDKDDPENQGKSDEELEDESIVDLPIEGIEETEYMDDTKAVGLYVDIAGFMDESDDDDEEEDGYVDKS